MGLIKLNNFTKPSRKLGYAYILTPKGINEKAQITSRFLKRKLVEYDLLTKEIEQLRAEVE